MPAERFFTEANLQGSVLITDAELHHLVHVMRVHVGDRVELVNGKGALGVGVVTAITKQEATLSIVSCTQEVVQPPRYILGVPLMRPAKLELIIEKGTELGADAFWLYPAQHSDKDSLSPHQRERLKHIAISAMKQCGRLDLPKIEMLVRFEDLFVEGHTLLFGDLNTKENRVQLNGPILFVTGPEKGFSPKELTLLEKQGQGILLHRNILRAETAPLAALLFLHYRSLA